MAPMASRKQSLYEILGVPREASTADIDAAYERRKAELEGSGSTDSNAMALLRDARDALRNPARRASYDASLTAAEARQVADEKAGKNAPPVVVEDVETQERKLPWLPIGIGLVILLIVVVVMSRGGKPETAEKHTEAMPGTTPATAPAPPPPAKKSGTEIIADASTSGGQVLSYSMSGQAIPVGLAVSTEPGTMITTCHGLPAGAKLVVRVQEMSYPADLLTTDEVLDLCRLQVAGFSTRPVKVATVPAKAGDAIFAVGADAAGKYAATAGTIKNVLDTTEGKLLELSMPVGQFSSGGGVFNDMGELVGIEMFQHRSGLSVAYPASWIAEMKSRQRAQAEATPPATPAAR
jgi:serine protease Do